MSVWTLIACLALGGAVALLLRWRNRRLDSEGKFRLLFEESEARFRNVFDNAPIGIYRTTPDGQILLANPTLVRMLGYDSFEQLSAINLEVNWNADTPRDEFKAILERDGEVFGRESQWMTRDRRDITVRENTRLVRDADGRALYYEGTIEDVTERRQTENRMAELHSRLEATIHNSPVAIVTLDLEGKVTGWNSRAEVIFGWSEAETLGSTPPIVCDRTAYQHRLKSYRAGRLLQNEEVHYASKDGAEIVAAVWTAPLRDSEGAVCGTVAMLADNSERKRQQEQLRETEERYRELFESASDIVYSLDLQGNYTSVNKAAEQATGYTREELLQRNISDVIEPEYLAYAHERIRARLGGARSKAFEVPCRRKDGSRIQLEITGRVTFSQGRPTGIQGIARDVTERKRWAERLEEYAAELGRKNEELLNALAAARDAVEAKSRFLANMSHEIRTPMNGVLGMADLLLGTSLDPEQREYTETVKSSAEGLLTIINDILDISKIEAGKLELEAVPFEPERLMNSVLAMLRPEALRKDLNFTGTLDSRTPPVLAGDEARLRQVLTNLAGNAVKFTPHGSVSIAIACETETPDEVTLFCTVEDTGIGISPEHAERLFLSFTQADSSTTRKYGGTGLGLAISKQLIELMGGEIGFDSEPGRGSKFWFRVPLSVLRDSELADSSSDLQVLSERLEREHAGGRILLAEDNEINRRIAVVMLRKAGFEVEAVPNGARAVAEALTGRFDAVLMDIHMPEKDGFEATAGIRAAEGSARHTPIIAMTARAMTGDREKCLAAGMDDYVSKPVRRQELIAAVTRWVKQPDPKSPSQSPGQSTVPAPPTETRGE